MDLFNNLLKVLDGKKTYSAALLAALAAANHVLQFAPPEYENCGLCLAVALGLWGLRQALEKLQK